MQTQRDHVHAYQTLVGRMSAALSLGDTNYAEPPARRALLGMVFGVVLALLVGVGFWVYGLINPGGNMAWRKPGAILMEKESGALYVFRDGLLIPMRNQASAMLFQGNGSRMESISRASLTELPRGLPVGIPDAPGSLPSPSSLVSTPWLVCLPQSGKLSVNLSPDAESNPVGADSYAWVSAASGEQYLVWRDQKLRVADPSVPVALGLGTGAPPVAPAPWLAALPDGPVIGAAEITGSASAKVGATTYPVGSLFKQDGTDRFYVLRKDGLAPMSRTESLLLQAKTGKSAVVVDAAAVASAPRSTDTELTRRIPDLAAAKAVLPGEQVLCLRQRTEQTTVFSEVVTTSRATGWIGMNEIVGAYVKPSTGVLVAAVPAPVETGRKPDRYLITDRGMKYLLADDDAIQALGLGGVTPRPMSADLLAAIPSGPTLSRAAVGVNEKGRG
ncbi:type VII secretion protein EccB [Allokutzneria albata]|uniref:Type VII secretion protein EccB n=1 Tax=Allokutzneria albata TaxID=211114 RepID=A0A1G9WA15_ALLAB|nr:type VII secretion protein EccB [Allokutzneria albata]SDM81408.1 type VII secretion protein EccB [Allokutzneria albata]